MSWFHPRYSSWSANCPPLRSKQCPFGFCVHDRATREGNTLAIYTAFVLHLCARYGIWASVEQPRNSLMFDLDIFRRLRARGFDSLQFPFCNYGTPFERGTRWLVNCPQLLRLSDSCRCPLKGRHLRLGATFTPETIAVFKACCRPSCLHVFGTEPEPVQALADFSMAYPIPAMHAMVQQYVAVIDKEACRPHRGSASGLLRRSYNTGSKSTITLMSMRDCIPQPHQTHGQKVAPSSRFCVLLDSQVVQGCNAKGRSFRQHLNCYLGSVIPYLLGANLYPSGIHIPSKHNPADDPSRAVSGSGRPPCMRLHGCCRCSLTSLLLLMPCGLLTHCSGLYVAGPGSFVCLARSMPRSKRVACEARKQVDLALTAGLRPATRCRRDRLHDELVGWTSCTLDADFAAISQMALQAFGRFLFYTGRSKYDFAEAINRTADRFGHFRPFLSAAWKLLTRWEEVEPVQRGMVFPEVVLRASFSQPSVELASFRSCHPHTLSCPATPGGDTAAAAVPFDFATRYVF